MSDETNELERQLEQATARSVTSGPPLDPETASLREAWLAFGQLMEAAQPATDQAVVAGEGVGRLLKSSHGVAGGGDIAHPNTTPATHHPQRAPRYPAWLVPAAVGLAASLLVAVTIAWIMRDGGNSSHSSPGGIASSPAGRPAAAKAEQRPTAASESQLAWDDTLDKQIVLAGEAVLSAQEDWSVLADAANSVHYGIRQMEKDVQGSPL